MGMHGMQYRARQGEPFRALYALGGCLFSRHTMICRSRMGSTATAASPTLHETGPRPDVVYIFATEEGYIQ